MNKRVTRFIAFVLAMALIADPVTAGAFCPGAAISSLPSSAYQSIFSEQVLAARLRQFFWQRPLDHARLSAQQVREQARVFRLSLQKAPVSRRWQWRSGLAIGFLALYKVVGTYSFTPPTYVDWISLKSEKYLKLAFIQLGLNHALYWTLAQPLLEFSLAWLMLRTLLRPSINLWNGIRVGASIVITTYIFYKPVVDLVRLWNPDEGRAPFYSGWQLVLMLTGISDKQDLIPWSPSVQLYLTSWTSLTLLTYIVNGVGLVATYFLVSRISRLFRHNDSPDTEQAPAPPSEKRQRLKVAREERTQSEREKRDQHTAEAIQRVLKNIQEERSLADTEFDIFRRTIWHHHLAPAQAALARAQSHLREAQRIIKNSKHRKAADIQEQQRLIDVAVGVGKDLQDQMDLRKKEIEAAIEQDRERRKAEIAERQRREAADKEQARLAAEVRVKQEAAERARLKARREAEEAERLRLEEAARIEQAAAEQARREALHAAEAAEQARREAVEAERLRKEAEDRERIERETAEKVRLEAAKAAKKAVHEAERQERERIRIKREADEKARVEAAQAANAAIREADRKAKAAAQLKYQEAKQARLKEAEKRAAVEAGREKLKALDTRLQAIDAHLKALAVERDERLSAERERQSAEEAAIEAQLQKEDQPRQDVLKLLLAGPLKGGSWPADWVNGFVQQVLEKRLTPEQIKTISGAADLLSRRFQPKLYLRISGLIALAASKHHRPLNTLDEIVQLMSESQPTREQVQAIENAIEGPLLDEALVEHVMEILVHSKPPVPAPASVRVAGEKPEGPRRVRNRHHRHRSDIDFGPWEDTEPDSSWESLLDATIRKLPRQPTHHDSKPSLKKDGPFDMVAKEGYLRMGPGNVIEATPKLLDQFHSETYHWQSVRRSYTVSITIRDARYRIALVWLKGVPAPYVSRISGPTGIDHFTKDGRWSSYTSTSMEAETPPGGFLSVNELIERSITKQPVLQDKGEFVVDIVEHREASLDLAAHSLIRMRTVNDGSKANVIVFDGELSKLSAKTPAAIALMAFTLAKPAISEGGQSALVMLLPIAILVAVAALAGIIISGWPLIKRAAVRIYLIVTRHNRTNASLPVMTMIGGVALTAPLDAAIPLYMLGAAALAGIIRVLPVTQRADGRFRKGFRSFASAA